MSYAVYNVGYVYDNVKEKVIWRTFDELSEAEEYAHENSKLYHSCEFEVIELPTVEDLSKEET